MPRLYQCHELEAKTVTRKLLVLAISAPFIGLFYLMLPIFWLGILIARFVYLALEEIRP